MCLKRVFVISILICWASGAQNICTIEGIENLNLLYTSEKVISDNHEGEVERFPTLNIDSAFIEDSLYLKATVDETDIIISTTPEFSKIEDNRDEVPITATLVTVCAGEENRLKYVLELKDTNNHAPKFEKDVYNYAFYDIIPNTDEFNLNEFEEVAAIDADFSNQNVTITIEENDFLELKGTGVQDIGDLHRFIANLVLKQRIVAPFKKTFVITATDSGDPPLSGTSEIVVDILRSAPPVFTKSLYEAYVNEDGQIVMINGEIALDNVTNFEDIRFDISAEYERFFNLKITDKIELEISEDRDPSNLVSEDNGTITITIYAEGKDLGIYAETAVLLNMEALLDDSKPVVETEDTSDEKDVIVESSEEDLSEEGKPETLPFPDYTPEIEESSKPPLDLGPAYELRGLRYWLDVNKTYIVMFSVLTGCAVVVFFCVLIKGRNVKIS